MIQLKPFVNKQVVDLKDFTNRGDHVTHGDVIIYRIDKSDMPENFNDLPEVPAGLLALGEHSGHAHKLMDNDYIEESVRPNLVLVEGLRGKETNPKFSLRETPDKGMFLEIREPVLLRHQEHRPFRLYPGNYEIGIQLETNPFDDMIRALRD